MENKSKTDERKEQEEFIEAWTQNFIKDQQDLPIEYQIFLDDNFWELLA